MSVVTSPSEQDNFFFKPKKPEKPKTETDPDRKPTFAQKKRSRSRPKSKSQDRRARLLTLPSMALFQKSTSVLPPRMKSVM
jgi:hypothetical protein